MPTAWFQFRSGLLLWQALAHQRNQLSTSLLNSNTDNWKDGYSSFGVSGKKDKKE
jgi:hypothetical protein